jgi:hypothetical protein
MAMGRLNMLDIVVYIGTGVGRDPDYNALTIGGFENISHLPGTAHTVDVFVTH